MKQPKEVKVWSILAIAHWGNFHKVVGSESHAYKEFFGHLDFSNVREQYPIEFELIDQHLEKEQYKEAYELLEEVDYSEEFDHLEVVEHFITP